MTTRTQALDKANPNDVCDIFRAIDLGTLLEGLRPRLVARSGLASSATQVHNFHGPILAVTDAAGTTGLTQVTGTPGAAEVQVTYNSDGLATLVFGDGANTAYNVLMIVIPSGHGGTMAATHGGAI